MIYMMQVQVIAHKKKARQVLHHMYSYAVKYEIIPPEKDISRYVDIDKDKKSL